MTRAGSGLAPLTMAFSKFGSSSWSRRWRITPPVSGQCLDRKSTRLNSSHLVISYAVFCLKKKKNRTNKSYTTLRIADQELASSPLRTPTIHNPSTSAYTNGHYSLGRSIHSVPLSVSRTYICMSDGLRVVTAGIYLPTVNVLYYI